MAEVKIIKEQENGVLFFEMKTDELRMIVSNMGCNIRSVFAKDRNGNEEDVVLALERVEDCDHDGSYMGSVVGRVANRIGGSSFNLNGKKYDLYPNNGKNHLHGGKVGFNQKIFNHEILKDGIKFHYFSPDMEEGYPGNLDFYVYYQLEGTTFSITYEAVCDADTIVNFTNHSYFNLSGGKEKIYNHKLQVKADKIACADKACLANGEFLDVTDTAFDFRELHEIGERIDSQHEQMLNGGGYDHSFIINAENEQIQLIHEASGRSLTITTDMPAVQVYSANFLAGGCNGKHGKPYKNRDGVALETQLLPNAIHIEEEPSVILRKGEQFKSTTSYHFGVI